MATPEVGDSPHIVCEREIGRNGDGGRPRGVISLVERNFAKGEGDCRSMNSPMHILDGLPEDKAKELIIACAIIADPLSQELMKKAAEP